MIPSPLRSASRRGPLNSAHSSRSKTPFLFLSYWRITLAAYSRIRASTGRSEAEEELDGALGPAVAVAAAVPNPATVITFELGVPKLATSDCAGVWPVDEPREAAWPGFCEARSKPALSAVIATGPLGSRPARRRCSRTWCGVRRAPH